MALVTMRRPAVRNAVNADLSAAVGGALEEADADPTVRAIVVTGEGDAFCAGADLRGIAAGQLLTAPDHPEWGFAGLVEHELRTPLIAAVNGPAMGGGAEIVLACDLAVMAQTAVIGLPEVKRGLFAAAGGLLRLPREIPQKVAMRIVLTGDPIDAATALRWGLVNDVVAPDDVVERALALGRRIAANAPLALAVSKRLVRDAVGTGAAWDVELWRRQDEEMARLLTTRDAHEGATAFTEKRPPVWEAR
ncbi:enoyl-CoA hydratase-related protein [Micromonospora olivasterospora]|uniref:enoyl-CoA hydratase-related protein n=1 Tax=Micromonospora olivasterospora TaxID=1880 RepID=UPI001FE301D3|nr:enoyl-CoA hydratase-related protein [Micromonospora olivasterospora]